MMSIRRNLTAGLLTAIPLWVTWLVIAFVLGLAVDIVTSSQKTGPLLG